MAGQGEEAPSNPISDCFEMQFMSLSFREQLTDCDQYKLASVFMEWLPSRQPFLEAGCGSGRWVAWFISKGWNAVGLDWSEALCQRARQEVPCARFESGDFRNMPFRDHEFGSIVALGSVEHSIEGPVAALREFHRVLRPGGIAIITVPNGGPLRKLSRLAKTPVRSVKSWQWLRQVLGKAGAKGRSMREARRRAVSAWQPDFACGQDGWYFYEYNFTERQFRGFLREAGFSILEAFAEFPEEGLIHNFGKLAGSYDPAGTGLSLTSLGRAVLRLLPASYLGHMVCFIARRD